MVVGEVEQYRALDELLVAPPPQARRTRWVLAVGALLVALLAAAWWTARHPALEQGFLTNSMTMVVATDGYADTRWVAPDGGGRFLTTVHNAGRFPVVLRPVTGEDAEYAHVRVEGFRPVRMPQGEVAAGALLPQVEVPAGGHAALEVRVAQPRCSPLADGTRVWTSLVPVEVTHLRTRTLQQLPAPMELNVVGPYVPPAGC